MPRQSKTPYTCPCCGYNTSKKSHMHRHLNQLLKPCPKSENDIELTEEIKQKILRDRVYHIPKQTPQQIFIQQINNNQQINNYIAKMDTIDKIDRLNTKADVQLIPFGDQVIKDYGDIITMCNEVDTELSKLMLRKPDIMNIIDKLTRFDTIDTMNVVYDKTPNKLSIYDDGVWESHEFENGVTQLVEKIKLSYLDNYEEFLLDKLDTDDFPRERQRAKEMLEEYYKFIVSFDLRPLILESQRSKIIELNARYYNMYVKVKNNIKLSHAKELKRSVLQMVKANCSASVLELNKKMMDIICTDEEFKNIVLQRLQTAQ